VASSAVRDISQHGKRPEIDRDRKPRPTALAALTSGDETRVQADVPLIRVDRPGD
jgi:hypothetical protein